MNAQNTTHNMKRFVNSESLNFTLASIIAAAMFAFPTVAWAQNADWIVYNTSNSGLPYNGITVLDFDSQGNVWIGTGKWYVLGGGGLAKFDGENWTVFNTANSPLPHNDHFGLAVDSLGNVWSGTEGGLAKFDGTNWTVYKTSNSGLPDNRVATPVFDDQGHLWAGTWEGGLVKFDSVSWTVYNTANSGLPNNIPFATAFDKQGNLWIGMVGGGLVKFDGTNWTVFNTANSPLPNNTIFSICFDSRGNLWIATDGGGLAKFDGTNWVVFNTSNSDLPSNRSWFAVVDAHDNVWIGTYDRGMAMFDGEEWTVYNTSNSGLPDNMLNYVAIDAQGNVWIATQNGGLAVYRPAPAVDLNADGKVDFTDFSMLAQYWYQDQSPFGNHRVDFKYLAALAECWMQDNRVIAHWKLDETEGTVAHDSAGDNDGTVNGDPNWQPTNGMANGALQFDGVADYISTEFTLNPVAGSFSVFAWIKGGRPGQVIVSQKDLKVGRFFHVGSTWLGADPSDGRLITTLMEYPHGPLESEVVITDGQWHHVGLVYDLDASCRRLYVDGVEVARDTNPVGGAASAGSLYIGAGKYLDAGSFFLGLIDDVRIYNVALSAAEIEELLR
jgi:sugar lactone lactonase YvrE